MLALGLMSCGTPAREVEPAEADVGDATAARDLPVDDRFGATEPRTLGNLDYLSLPPGDSPASCDEFAEQHLQARALSLVDVLAEAELCPDPKLAAPTFRARVAASHDAHTRRALAAQARDRADLEELVALLDLLLGGPESSASTIGPGSAPSEASAPLKLPDPAQALVLPLTREVLHNVALAHAIESRAESITDPDARTRADAYLAKVYLQSLRILGPYARAPLGPAARELAGRALYYGRRFCQRYVQRRVVGLASLFAQTEVDMLALAVALDESPFSGDSAMTVIGRERARDWLRSDKTRARLERQLASRNLDEVPSINRLLSLSDELGRLIAAGYSDLALDRASRALLRKEPVGVEEVSTHLRGIAAETSDRRLARRTEQLIKAVQAKGARPVGAAAFEAPTRSTSTIGRDVLQHWLALHKQSELPGAAADAWSRSVASSRARALLFLHPELRATLVEQMRGGEITLEASDRAWFVHAQGASDSRLRPWLVAAALGQENPLTDTGAPQGQAAADRRARLFWATQASDAAADQLARAPGDEESLQIIDEPQTP